jgi:hypothetical protein
MLDKLLALLPHKLRAFSIHFLISLAIFAGLLYLIVVRWYPWPWFPIDGGWQGVRIMIGVDLVLGPVLTFMLFNPAKGRRELTLDFSLIALIQAGALAWGIHLVHGQRPLAIVYWYGAFHSVDSKSPGFKNYPIERLDTFGERKPVLVFQVEPESEEKKIEMAMAIMGNDQAEHEHPEYYRPLQPHLPEVFVDALDAARLRELAPDVAKRLDRLLERHGLKPEDAYLLPFDGRYQQAILVIAKDGRIIGHLPEVRPLPRVNEKTPPPAADA